MKHGRDHPEMNSSADPVRRIAVVSHGEREVIAGAVARLEAICAACGVEIVEGDDADLAVVLGPGLVLTWSYVGAWGGLLGTGYGVMVLTKVALLACAMALGGLNFLLLRGGGLLLRGGGPLLRRKIHCKRQTTPENM